MSVFTAKEIIVAFNFAVVDLMNKGYIISPFTESGSYSNTRTHVDLINPNDNSHIIRVWLSDERIRIGERFWQSIDCNGVRVKKYKNGVGYDGNFSREQTLWPGKEYGEVLYEKMFYAFVERKGKRIYSDDLDEAKKYVTMQCDRVMNATTDKYNLGRSFSKERLTPKFVDGIMNRINSTRGFRRATASCITSVEMYKYDNKLKAIVKYNYNGKNGSIRLQ